MARRRVAALSRYPAAAASRRSSGTVQPTVAYPSAWGSLPSRSSSQRSPAASKRGVNPGWGPSAKPVTPACRQAAAQLYTLASPTPSTAATSAGDRRSAKSRSAW
jgi:hypothetical protein